MAAIIQKEISATEAKMRTAASQAAAQLQRDLAIAKADVTALSGSFETRVAHEVRLRMSELQLDHSQSRSEEMQVRFFVTGETLCFPARNLLYRVVHHSVFSCFKMAYMASRLNCPL